MDPPHDNSEVGRNLSFFFCSFDSYVYRIGIWERDISPHE